MATTRLGLFGLSALSSLSVDWGKARMGGISGGIRTWIEGRTEETERGQVGGCMHVNTGTRYKEKGNKKSRNKENKRAERYDDSEATDKKQQGLTHISSVASLFC